MIEVNFADVPFEQHFLGYIVKPFDLSCLVQRHSDESGREFLVIFDCVLEISCHSV